jgi:hypothetical protein
VTGVAEGIQGERDDLAEQQLVSGYMMSRRKESATKWPHIDELVRYDGDIVIGRLSRIGCVATAADGHNALAMLVRRSGESLEDLLTRLDEAIRKASEEAVYTDEVNS